MGYLPFSSSGTEHLDIRHALINETFLPAFTQIYFLMEWSMIQGKRDLDHVI
jgi:hypothetical protein